MYTPRRMFEVSESHLWNREEHYSVWRSGQIKVRGSTRPWARHHNETVLERSGAELVMTSRKAGGRVMACVVQRVCVVQKVWA